MRALAFIFLLWVLIPVARAQLSSTNALTAARNSSAKSTPDAQKLLVEGYQDIRGGHPDAALAKANAVLLLDPRDVRGYILRGSVYALQSQWASAEREYDTAALLAPKNTLVTLDRAVIKFQQKDYAASRAGFVKLLSDPEDHDFAVYEIYLCDLLGGNAKAAAQELAALNQAGSGASYYYGNVAYNLVNHHPEEARSWLISADHIFSRNKNLTYSSGLLWLGYLPLHSPYSPIAPMANHDSWPGRVAATVPHGRRFFLALGAALVALALLVFYGLFRLGRAMKWDRSRGKGGKRERRRPRYVPID